MEVFSIVSKALDAFVKGPAPALAHEVTPGVDYEFIPNVMNPYSP